MDVVRTPYFKIDFAVSVAVSFFLVTYIQRISIYLNKKYSWQGQFRKRIIQQVLWGWLVPALILVIIISIYFFVVMHYQWSQVTFFYSEFPVSLVVLAAVNFFYAAWFFFKENEIQKTEMYQLQQQIFTLQQQGLQVIAAVDEPENVNVENLHRDEAVAVPSQKVRTLVAVSGNKNVPIATEQIAYIIKEGNFTKLTTFQSHSYLLNHTLDDLMNLLDDASFFRANRQAIINIKACHYFTNEENGKLALHLTPATEDEVIISQKRASLFKEWLHK